MKKILSIVLPIYNVSQYLPRCLDSILNQGLTADEYEVLLVDDGSTDNSAEVCRSYVSAYPDIFHLISKPNGGVSSARNMGIERAKGEYIYFVDPDDFLHPGGLGKVLPYITEQPSVDILQFSAVWINEKDISEHLPPLLTSDVIYQGNASESPILNTTVWNIVIRSSLLIETQLRFKPIALGEDSLFYVELILQNCTICIINSAIYYYIRRDGSATMQKSQQRMRKAVDDSRRIFREIDTILRTLPPTHHGYSKVRWLLGCTTCVFLSRLLHAKFNRDELMEIINDTKHIIMLARPSKSRQALLWLYRHPSMYPFISKLYGTKMVGHLLKSMYPKTDM